MSVDDAERRLVDALTAEYERHRTTATPPGSQKARATVTRRRRVRAAATAAIAVLVVGVGAGLIRGAEAPDHLIPATTPTAATALREIDAPECGDPAVTYRDGVRLDAPASDAYGWSFSGPSAALGDVDGDGRDEYVAYLQCVHGQQRTGPTWLVALTGWNEDLSVTGHPYPLGDVEVTSIGVENNTVLTRLKADGQTKESLVRWTGERFQRTG